MEDFEFDDIEKIAIVVEMKDGTARQVLANKYNKRLALVYIASAEEGLRLSKPIVPIEFKLL